jgi:hypothetical protein
VQLRFQDQDFSWKFLLANVSFLILGVDFLRFHKLLIDPTGHALLNSTGRQLYSPARPSPPTATPFASQFHKLDSEKLAAAKAEFKQLDEGDIIQRSTSSCSRPPESFKVSH